MLENAIESATHHSDSRKRRNTIILFFSRAAVISKNLRSLRLWLFSNTPASLSDNVVFFAVSDVSSSSAVKFSCFAGHAGEEFQQLNVSRRGS